MASARASSSGVSSGFLPRPVVVRVHSGPRVPSSKAEHSALNRKGRVRFPGDSLVSFRSRTTVVRSAVNRGDPGSNPGSGAPRPPPAPRRSSRLVSDQRAVRFRAGALWHRKLAWWKRRSEAPEVLVRFQPDAPERSVRSQGSGWATCFGSTRWRVRSPRLRLRSTEQAGGHGDRADSKSAGRGPIPRRPAARGRLTGQSLALQAGARGFDSLRLHPYLPHAHASVVQGQDHSLPSCRCGFDPRHSLRLRPVLLVARMRDLHSRDRGPTPLRDAMPT